MYFYIDESGHTGLNLFDDAQPFLYYGVLSSEKDLDVCAVDEIKNLHVKLGVERLHANVLGNSGLLLILDEILSLTNKYNIAFNFHRLTKYDYSIMSFFDQIFDQGINKAVPWSSYWTPLRYVLLVKLTLIVDEDLMKKAWSARISFDDGFSQATLTKVCYEIIARVNRIPDRRSRELITDAMRWVIKNPKTINYNIDDKSQLLQISPNLIGFQSVMLGISKKLENSKLSAKQIIVDRQSQFNKAQEFIADYYASGAKHGLKLSAGGLGLPEMDLKNMPTIPVLCKAGTDSSGLELVDVFLWVFKRAIEGKNLAPQLFKVIQSQMDKCFYDDVSISAIIERWTKPISDMPEPTGEELAKAKQLKKIEESFRKSHL